MAAALLLRIKSEFLLNKSIKSIDEVLFGRKEETRPIMERIIVDENELPVLIPKTPLPRARRVTLNELMLALNKAINTESRRIKREVSFKRAKRISEINLPEFRKIDLKDRIKQFYAKVLTSIKKKAVKPHREYNQITYNSLIGKEREEKVACFLPLLHLSNNKKLWLEQENHLEEIWVYLHNYFEKNRDLFSSEYDEGLEEDIGEGEIMGSSEHPENEGSSDSSNPKGFEHVEGERLSGLEKARLKREEKKKMEEAIARELAEELGEDVEKLDKDKKIEEVSGFANED